MVWLKDPTKPRPGEQIGGGWIVFRRGRRTKRIRPSGWCFEHPTREAAETEARRLAEENPGQTFCVFQQAVMVIVPADETTVEAA